MTSNTSITSFKRLFFDILKKWSDEHIYFISIVSANWNGMESLVNSISRLFIEFKKSCKAKGHSEGNL